RPEVVVERPVLLDEDHDVLDVAEPAGAGPGCDGAAEPGRPRQARHAGARGKSVPDELAPREVAVHRVHNQTTPAPERAARGYHRRRSGQGEPEPRVQSDPRDRRDG